MYNPIESHNLRQTHGAEIVFGLLPTSLIGLTSCILRNQFEPGNGNLQNKSFDSVIKLTLLLGLSFQPCQSDKFYKIDIYPIGYTYTYECISKNI